MTGRYPHRMGITDFISHGGKHQPENWTKNTRLLPAPNVEQLPAEELTLAEALGKCGYRTFFAGKWHLGDRSSWPTDHGFEINVGGTRGGSPASYFSPYKNVNLPDGPDGEHLPMRLADEFNRLQSSGARTAVSGHCRYMQWRLPSLIPKREAIRRYGGDIHASAGQFVGCDAVGARIAQFDPNVWRASQTIGSRNLV